MHRILLVFIFAWVGSAEAVMLNVVRPEPGEGLSMPMGFTFVLGRVTPANSVVTCNGVPCEVDDEGAFLGFVPIKRFGGWKEENDRLCDAVFSFEARDDEDFERLLVYAYTPRSPSAARLAQEVYEPPRAARVLRDQWIGLEGEDLGNVVLLPKGSLVQVAAGSVSNYVCQLPENGEVTISANELETTEEMPGRTPEPQIFQISGQSEIAPFWKASLECDRVWGFWAESRGDHLKFQPRCFLLKKGGWDEVHPLRGLRVCLDPGHNPDRGAVGPRGFEERNSALLIARVAAELLRREGAEVEFTHESEALPLKERHARIHELNPDILVSIHNNSVGDGDDPRMRRGTQTFYLFPWSKLLAEEVHRSMLLDLGTKDRGCIRRNLYITRYPGCPSILVEPEYLVLPDQEKKFLDPAYRLRLAGAIVDGIRRFVMQAGEKRKP